MGRLPRGSVCETCRRVDAAVGAISYPVPAKRRLYNRAPLLIFNIYRPYQPASD